MARRKTITREEILQAAFNLVSTDGFGHFTARNVAQKVGSSTQPIYLEFKNMDDLKEAVYLKIQKYLTEEIFTKRYTDDILVDLALNYIYFAKKETSLYKALFLDSSTDGKKVAAFSLRFFIEKISQEAAYQNLSQEELESLHLGLWITSTGIASLMSAGIIHPNQEEIIELIKTGVKTNFILKSK